MKYTKVYMVIIVYEIHYTKNLKLLCYIYIVKDHGNS